MCCPRELFVLSGYAQDVAGLFGVIGTMGIQNMIKGSGSVIGAYDKAIEGMEDEKNLLKKISIWWENPDSDDGKEIEASLGLCLLDHITRYDLANARDIEANRPIPNERAEDLKDNLLRMFKLFRFVITSESEHIND